MSELNYMQERLRQAVHSIRLVVPQSQWDDFIAEIAEIGVSVNWFMLDSTTIQSLIWN
jgi:hypothetical protein